MKIDSLKPPHRIFDKSRPKAALITLGMLGMTTILAGCSPKSEADAPSHNAKPSSQASANLADTNTADNAAKVVVRDFNFGTLSAGGVEIPQQGLLILPDDTKQHPVIIISHLRAPNCDDNEFAYPCPKGVQPRRFDHGMQYLGEALAKAGYAVIIPDLSVIYSGVATGELSGQQALWRQAMTQIMDKLQADNNTAKRMDFGQIGLFVHSRSAEMVNTAADLFGERLRGVFGYGPSAETNDFDHISPPPADVPYLAVLGKLDADVNQAATQWLGHWLDKPRQNAISVVSIPGFGHNYINRTLSSIGFDDRVGCDMLACADVDAHEKLVTDAALSWFDATLKSAPTTLPQAASDALPDTIFGIDAEWLSATPKAIATVNYDDFVADGDTLSLCRHANLMTREQVKAACDEPELGVISTITHIAKLTHAHANIQVAKASGMAIHLSPWGSRNTKVNDGVITITLSTQSGKTATISTPPQAHALRDQADELSNGLYQLGTIRLNLPDDLAGETISKIAIDSRLPIEVRSVDFY
ncbi:dienelactone hydrolase family protein [Moraxella marmotae]|uniref:dienelactone hydrolase family protein n=1 Tax=Moraxella marmotae TaxID=3344520 RepID=UPI0035F2D35F